MDFGKGKNSQFETAKARSGGEGGRITAVVRENENVGNLRGEKGEGGEPHDDHEDVDAEDGPVVEYHRGAELGDHVVNASDEIKDGLGRGEFLVSLELAQLVDPSPG